MTLLIINPVTKSWNLVCQSSPRPMRNRIKSKMIVLFTVLFKNQLQ